MVVLGAVNWDTTIFVEAFPGRGEETPVARILESPGGKGANVAAAAARILGKGAVAFVGAIGDDGPGESLKQSLVQEGVSLRGLVTVKGSQSGKAFIVVDGAGSKVIHTLFGANELLAPGHLKSPKVARSISSSSALVIMDVPLPAAAAAGRLAADSETSVIYSPATRVLGPRERLEEVIAMAGTLVLDRAELARLRPGQAPSAAVRSVVRGRRGLTVVATLGKAGSLVARGGTVSRVPPFDLEELGLKAVNSTGSGDAFLAAYACRLSQGSEPEEAALWGNLAGALKASDPLTRGSPTEERLEQAMSSRGVRRPRRG